MALMTTPTIRFLVSRIASFRSSLDDASGPFRDFLLVEQDGRMLLVADCLQRRVRLEVPLLDGRIAVRSRLPESRLARE